jgi:hypothetical protein
MECAICLRDYIEPAPVCNGNRSNKTRVLKCTHKFHVSCINTWFNETNTCPICRDPNPDENIITFYKLSEVLLIYLSI